jgi:DNA phosphorothioation-dependent restriction protein DptG
MRGLGLMNMFENDLKAKALCCYFGFMLQCYQSLLKLYRNL